jgi:hypothetical protein
MHRGSRRKRTIALGVLLILLPWHGYAAATTITSDATRTITFTNTEVNSDGTAANANDLHVIFNQPTIVTSNPFGNDRTSATAPDVHNFWGMTVAGGKAGASVTLAFSSDMLDLTIKNWWWTTGGTATSDGTQLGATKNDNGGTILSFLDGTATGNGDVNVQINGASHVFATTAGFTAMQSATAFDQFLTGLTTDGFSLVDAVLTAPSTVEAVGNLQGDPATELNISILSQDSSQTVLLEPLSVVPEPSSVVLLGIGCAGAAWAARYARRRRTPA